MVRLLITFVLFAGIIYYFNVDIIRLIDRSGIPTWLSDNGYRVQSEVDTSTATTTIVAE